MYWREIGNLCTETEKIDSLGKPYKELERREVFCNEKGVKRKKHDIQPLSEAYLQLIKSITPVSFKYNSDIAQSGRTHTGFIAQSVLEKMAECGLATEDFATFVDLGNDGEEYALRYEEFIPLVLMYVQALEKRIETLERT